MLSNVLRSLTQYAGIDRAVAFGILTKAWQVPSGAVTMLVITFSLTPETQGVYYTIFGILGLQNMAEAGLTSVLMHAVSHEWSSVHFGKDGRLTGEQTSIDRIASLARGGVKSLAICGSLFAVAAIAWGLWVFLHGDAVGVPEKVGTSTIVMVLVVSVVLSAFSLVSAGLVAIVEGCNQVESVNRNRLGQVISGSLIVWLVLGAGGTIWAIAASLAVQLVWEMNLLLIRYRSLMVGLWQLPHTEFNWREAVWPLQWRIALQSFAHQLAFAPMIPVLYSFHGAVVAGQAGMTLTTLIQLQGVSSMWIRTRAPRFGELIARGNRLELTQLFRRTTLHSTVALFGILTLFLGVLAGMSHSDVSILSKLAARFLMPIPAAWIAVALIPLHVMHCFAIYLRAHKVDPLWRITICCNLLLAVAVVFGEARYGAIALGVPMTLIYGGLGLPAVIYAWTQFRNEHKAVSDSIEDRSEK